MPVEFGDRASVDERSPYFDPRFRTIGVTLNGKVMPNGVFEYCISEGWVSVPVMNWDGTYRTERGAIVLIKRKGKVEVYERLKIVEGAK